MSNKSVEFTYVSLWTTFSILKSMYDSAWIDHRQKDQALALRLAALTIGFFSLEAFLNHVICAVNPDVWGQERKYFGNGILIGGNQYYGPMGKLAFVHAQCAITYDEHSGNVSVVKKLKTLRDAMAHARTHEDSPADILASAFPPPHPNSKLFDLAPHELVTTAFDHLKGLRLLLFEAAKRAFPNADLGPNPDLAISMWQIISVVP